MSNDQYNKKRVRDEIARIENGGEIPEPNKCTRDEYLTWLRKCLEEFQG